MNRLPIIKKSTRSKKFPGALACFFAPAIFAADLPPLVLPYGMGVNIHFTRGHEVDLNLIRGAGFKFIRMDFVWSVIERQRGVYDFSDYDELTLNLEQRGIRALYILDYSNPLYESAEVPKNPVNGREQRDPASPQHPESIAAFARWAAASAKHFKGHRVIWEIWNEPNISFWKPKPDAAQYAALALATAKAVRQADPNATIIGPASSEFPWSFLETFCASGVLDYLDAVSVHPYRGGPPETAARDFARLREMIDQFKPAGAGKNIPIISGEWGYSSHTKGVTAEQQAGYLARQQLSNLSQGVPISIWYDWKNDGENPAENEDNFGTVFPDLKPKPAYAAATILTHELGGFALAEKLPMAHTNDCALALTNSTGTKKIAAWTLKEPHTATIKLNAPIRSARAVDCVGKSAELKTQEQSIETELTGAPRYITVR